MVLSEENIDNSYKYPNNILKIKDTANCMTIRIFFWDCNNINLFSIINCYESKNNLKLKIETVIAIKMIKIWR